MRVPKTCRLLGWRRCHYQIADLLFASRLPKTVARESKPHVNNSDTSKIHFVVVFVDMAVDLGALVEHRNSPFVFYQSKISVIAQLQHS